MDLRNRGWGGGHALNIVNIRGGHWGGTQLLENPTIRLNKIKDAVQKSNLPEAKNFRNFHSKMQFSLSKLHFADEKSANFSPAPLERAKFLVWAPHYTNGNGGGGRRRRGGTVLLTFE